MAFLKAHPYWYSRSAGPIEHLDEDNSTRSGPSLQEADDVNKNWNRNNPNNFIPHSKLFSETEGFLIDGASFMEIKFSDPPVLRPHAQTFLLFPFP